MCLHLENHRTHVHSFFYLFLFFLVTKGRWKKLCRPPTHGVSQYRFTAARVQWPCSTVSIKPFWSLKCSGQVCTLFIVRGLCKWISAATKLWADYRTLVSIRIFRIACGGCNFCVLVCAGNDPASKITITLVVPAQQRVIGFSFQLAIIQHQFALHALGYCHLCKDNHAFSKFCSQG